jgi:T5SS/PEP-CTERM-associated repeat protein
MYLNSFHAMIERLFARFRRRRAVCPVVVRTAVRCLVICAVLQSARSASASVLTADDVWPKDDPFTTFKEELPKEGNAPDPTATPAPAVTNQITWEGIPDFVNNINYNTNVFVGVSGSGTLQIVQVELRDMNLVIGDSKSIGPNQTLYGTGVVYITGMGSLFNNDPYLIPNYLPSNISSKVPRLGAANPTTLPGKTAPVTGLDGEPQGLDLYVGRTGTGTLRIDSFGRAEIEDAVLVGDATGASGNIVVDGFSSSLRNGGSANFGQNSNGNWHLMILGRQGNGQMTVSNGGLVQSQVFSTAIANSAPTIGASLGSTPFSSTVGQAPDPGGSGTVTVTGSGSRWLLGGSLQVGGFDIGINSDNTIGDLEGDDVLYGNDIGKGYLYVNDSGLVDVRNPVGVAADDTITSLVMAVGREGLVQLAGGKINIGSNLAGQGQQHQAKSDNVRVINDGTIKGYGEIDTGVFQNRYLGRVSVDLGKTLTVQANAQHQVADGVVTPDPIVNFGLIEVIGTQDQRSELDFERVLTTPRLPMINRIVFPPNAIAPPDPDSSLERFSGGMMNMQWSTLRSTAGIQNEGIMAFTAGINIVQAHVEQVVGATGFVPQLKIGPQTSVIVEDDCLGCAPIFTGVGNTLQVLDPGTFTSNGRIQLTLSKTSPNTISAGDVAISGTVALTYASDVLSDLAANGPGQKYDFITFAGQAYQTATAANGVPIPDYSSVIPDCTALTSCVVPGLGVTGPNLAAILGPAFNNVVPVAQRLGQSIMIAFLNPASSGAVGPDFNGDGVIDLLDFQIWKDNVGLTSGATVLQGDADGDGDVDGADFLFWQRNFGKPAPWSSPGIGSGSFLDSNVVPEPTSLVILLSAASLATVFGRRRRSR